MSDSIDSDAQIIPIGTSGRPGRGTGRDRPSAAARGLAGTSKPAARKAAKKPANASATSASTTPLSTPSATAQGTSSITGGESAAPSRPGATTQERHPLAGVPIGEWLAAFQGAADAEQADRPHRCGNDDAEQDSTHQNRQIFHAELPQTTPPDHCDSDKPGGVCPSRAPTETRDLTVRR